MRRARGRIGQEVTARGLARLAPSLLFPIDVVQYSGAAIQCAGAALCFGLIIVGIAISPPELLVPTTFSRLAYASFELSFPHPQVISFLVGRGAFIAVQT
ncbi:hypothetical protein [Endobacterium cereale]|nr:hypothetical protein [Endobacterium cereale]